VSGVQFQARNTVFRHGRLMPGHHGFGAAADGFFAGPGLRNPLFEKSIPFDDFANRSVYASWPVRISPVPVDFTLVQDSEFVHQSYMCV
jgi:hypothetical protein